MKVNVLITAGGTVEPIDSVRSITNAATGRLGSLAADYFERSGQAEQIFYVCGKTAQRPESSKAEITVIGDTVELERTIRTLLSGSRVDVILHSMAVSDYRVRTVTTPALIADSLAAACGGRGSPEKFRTRCTEALEKAASLERDKKISSDEERLVLILEATPKIISFFNELAPRALLVGFKLLNHVPHEELIDTACKLMEKNRCAFVLANDARDIHGDTHIAYLIDRDKKARRYETKQEIAQGIVDQVIAVFNRRAEN
jgi:phosphopantothenate-cysteine ligase